MQQPRLHAGSLIREAVLRHGFLTGHELTWMPEALRTLRDELPNVDVMISSQYSPVLADGLSKGKLDAAFLRRNEDCQTWRSVFWSKSPWR